MVASLDKRNWHRMSLLNGFSLNSFNMFGQFFRKKVVEALPTPQPIPPPAWASAYEPEPAPALPKQRVGPMEFDDEAKAFVTVVLRLLHKNGYPSFGDEFYLEGDWEDLVEEMKEIGFAPNLELLVMDEWRKALAQDRAADTKDFGLRFVATFCTAYIEPVVPGFVRERNRKLLGAYHQVVEAIKRTQGWLQEEELRERIATVEGAGLIGEYTICECVTRFCYVCIVCDRMGRYSLLYSVDSDLAAKISKVFASVLIRRIYQFTPGEMEPFVLIGSLYADCSKSFDSLASVLPNSSYELEAQAMWS